MKGTRQLIKGPADTRAIKRAAYYPRRSGRSDRPAIRQWYFRCPATQSRCSVLWMPPGARHFCSRQAWRKQVAYASQFESPADRARRGQAKIKSRLIGNRDPDDWDMPPKPRWMRWGTYDRHVQRFNEYEDVVEENAFGQLARLLTKVSQ